VLDLGAGDVGNVMGAITFFAGIVGAISLGILVDYLFSRKVTDAALRVFVSCALTAAPLTTIGFLSGNATFMFAGVGLLLLTVGSCFGPALATMQMISPPLMRGRFGALGVLAANVGGLTLGPLMIGTLTDYVFRDSQSIGFSIAVANAVLGPASAALVWWARRPFVELLVEKKVDA
jgi:hypothetical protein